MPDITDSGVFLSIVINNYNYDQYVQAAIDSALAAASATNAECEVIVVDDGSTDDSLEIIKACNGIQVIAKENGGQASALNAGYAVAKGRYIHFLDADDLLEEDAVEIIRRVMPGKHMVHFSIEVLDQKLGVVSFYNSTRVEPQPRLWTDYFGKGTAWTRPMSCNVFSAELLSNIFPLPEKNWRICADQVAICLGSLFTTYEGSPEVINRYRMHGSNLYFSNTRSTFEMHIYDDQLHYKNSENHRHFFVVGCDALARVDDANTYCAVFGNWVRYGDFLLSHAKLTEEHRKDISDATDTLIASKAPGFWRIAASALFGKMVNPEHLVAFHRPPGEGVLNSEVAEETPPQLCFNKAIRARELSAFLLGGFITSDDDSGALVFSLSQASRFTARVNALSGVFRLLITVSSDSLAGAVRCVSSHGQIAETVRVDDELLADIPCDWVVDDLLQFYFVFEKVQVPQAIDLSTFDLSLSGAYVHSIQFDVPLASHFYKPLRDGWSMAADRYVSPIKHLRTLQLIREDGAVPLSRSPTAFGVSLSYALESKEWLEFEIINDVDRIMVLIVEMWHSDDDGTLAVKDTISLAARSTTLLPIPIGFPLFDPVLPEVVLSSVLKLPAADSIRVNRLRYLQTPKDVVTVPTVGELSFCAGAIGSLGLGSEWHKNAEGISDNADRLMGSEPSSLTFRFDNSVITDCLVLSFALQTSTHAEHPPSTLTTKGIGIMMSINSQFVEAQLDDGGNCEVMTYGASEIVLDGWHSCPPGLQLRLKTVRRSPSLLY